MNHPVLVRCTGNPCRIRTEIVLHAHGPGNKEHINANVISHLERCGMKFADKPCSIILISGQDGFNRISYVGFLTMSSVVRLSRRSHTGARGKPKPGIIHSHDFRSVYQPILSPTHQKLVGYEALVRVSRNKHPISPLELFEQAASLDQIPELDRHLLHLHLSGFSAGDRPAWLFLNINPHTCIHPEASLERLAQQCKNSGIHPEKVVLELVETASENPEALMEFIHKAKAFPETWTDSPQAFPYLVLHRTGFTKLFQSPGKLVRSYRTVSPLP